MSDYGFVHNGRVYTPNQTPDLSPKENDARNTAIAQAELDLWATRPDGQIAYYHFPAEANRPHPRIYRESFAPLLDGAYVSVWTGARLGVITRGRVYRHNFGGRFVALTVKGTNGATYHGRASYDWGEVIRLYLSKETK